MENLNNDCESGVNNILSAILGLEITRHHTKKPLILKLIKFNRICMQMYFKILNTII